MLLDRQPGLSDAERLYLEEEWRLHETLLPADVRAWDAPRVALIERVAPFERPAVGEHEHPGSVKVNDGERDWYLSPLSSLCIDEGCCVYLWDDAPHGDFWVQHGDNEEAVRRFPRRFLLSPSLACNAERPDVLAWVRACHGRDDPEALLSREGA